MFESPDEPLFVIASMAVVRDGKVLLIKEGGRPYNGRWVLPQGHVKRAEKVRDAALRELREETGLDVWETEFLGIYEDFIEEEEKIQHHLFVCFRAEEPKSGQDPRVTSEAIEHAWVNHRNPPQHLPEVTKAMLRDLAKKKSRF